MTADREAIVYCRWNKLMGWSNVSVVIILAALTIRLAAAPFPSQKPQHVAAVRIATDEENVRELARLEEDVANLKTTVAEHDTDMRAITEQHEGLETRLAVLEKTGDYNKDLLIGIVIGLVLLLVGDIERRWKRGTDGRRGNDGRQK
jgi:hypothetical protein